MKTSIISLPIRAAGSGGDEMDAADDGMTETAADVDDQIEALEDAGEAVIEDQAGEGELPDETADEGGN